MSSVKTGFYEKDGVRIRYQEIGSGFPLLAIPGGGLNSRIINCEGFRMSARRRPILAHGGRRTEASRDGTRERVGTRRRGALWGFGRRDGCSERRSAPKPARIGQAGRHDASCEGDCGGDMDAGPMLLSP